MKRSEFLKYINLVLISLQSNGGADDSSNVIEQVIEKLYTIYNFIITSLISQKKLIL